MDWMGVQRYGHFVMLLFCSPPPPLPLEPFTKPIERNYLQGKKNGFIKRGKVVEKGGN